MMSNYEFEDVSEMAKHSEKVHVLESRVKAWIKKLDEILKESEQIRRENDSSGKYRFDKFMHEIYKSNYLNFFYTEELSCSVFCFKNKGLISKRH